MTKRLAADLKAAFPEMKGFSPRNLVYMQTLARTYPNAAFTQQVVARIPWGHNVVILDKVRGLDQREWYLRHTAEYGWSRAVLVHQIEGRLFAREGQAQTNFSQALPAPQSDLAQQLLKDPYTFDFLGIGTDAEERELERSLVAHIRDFLLELGVGFAFLGSQYHLEVGNRLRTETDAPSIGLILCKSKNRVF